MMQKRLRGWLRAGAALAVVGGCAGYVVGDPETRAALVQRGERLDAKWLDGLVRRTYHRQRLPRVPKDLPPHAPGAYDWVGTEPFIAIGHALGPRLNGGDNSLLTLEQGLQMGFHLFEVDLVLTSDGELVCYHGDDESREVDALTYARYLEIIRDRGIGPCRFEDLVAVARTHAEVRFVLDVKSRFASAYGKIREQVGDLSVGRSFIPQIYDFDEAAAIRSGAVFAGEIFTSYRSAMTTAQILEAARAFDIRVVTLTLIRVADVRGRAPRDPVLLTHPVDDPILAADLRSRGLRGIFSSYLSPQTVPLLFAPWGPQCAPPRHMVGCPGAPPMAGVYGVSGVELRRSAR